MLAFLVRRLLWGLVVVAIAALLAYGGIRALRPDRFPDEPWLTGMLGDLERVFLHFDFGPACIQIGCPPMNELIARGWQADVFLFLTTYALGITLGVAGGILVALRPRALVSRLLEAAAMVALCAPVYFVGFALLLLFAPPFGVWQVPVLFELHSFVLPWESVPQFLSAMVVPSLVCAAPLAAICLRLTRSAMVEVEHEEFMRTAVAKGLPRRTVVRRHAAPAAYPAVASFLGVSVPAVVTNMVLVEIVFSVPGVFRHTRRAIQGPHPPGPDPTYEVLQALGVYAAVFIVAATILSDLALGVLDPRVRTQAA